MSSPPPGLPAPNPAKDSNGLTILRPYDTSTPVHADEENRSWSDMHQRDCDLFDIFNPVKQEVEAAGCTNPELTLSERLNVGLNCDGTLKIAIGIQSIREAERMQQMLRSKVHSGFLPGFLRTQPRLGVWRGIQVTRAIPSAERARDTFRMILNPSDDAMMHAIVNGWMLRLYEGDPSYNIEWTLPAAPTGPDVSPPSGKTRADACFIEVFLIHVDHADPQVAPFAKWGAHHLLEADPVTYGVTDPRDPSVVNTLIWDGEANKWIQIRWRKRVAASVNPESYEEGLNDPFQVYAQGAATSPVSARTFSQPVPGHDQGLWRAGDGSAADQTALGTLDGYVYAIPVAVVHRRNQSLWSLTNYNGTAFPGTAGTTGYLVADEPGQPALNVGKRTFHPQGLTFDEVAECDFWDRRHEICLADEDMGERLHDALELLVRGSLHTTMRQYLADPDGDFQQTEVSGAFGTCTPRADGLQANCFDSAEAVDWHDTSENGNSGRPDGIRRVWDDRVVYDVVSFSLVEGDNTSEAPTPLISYDPATQTITIDTTGLSGAPVIDPEFVPVMRWNGGDAVRMTQLWTGLGTQTASAVILATDHGGFTLQGWLRLLYPAGGGLRQALFDVYRTTRKLETKGGGILSSAGPEVSNPRLFLDSLDCMVPTKVANERIRDGGSETNYAQQLITQRTLTGNLTASDSVEFTDGVLVATVNFPHRLLFPVRARNPATGAELEINEIELREDSPSAGQWTYEVKFTSSGLNLNDPVEVDFEVDVDTVIYRGGARAIEDMVRWEEVDFAAGASSRTHILGASSRPDGNVYRQVGRTAISGSLVTLALEETSTGSKIYRDRSVNDLTAEQIAAGTTTAATMTPGHLSKFDAPVLSVTFGATVEKTKVFLLRTFAIGTTDNLVTHSRAHHYQGGIAEDFDIPLDQLKVEAASDRLLASVLGTGVAARSPLDPPAQLPVLGGIKSYQFAETDGVTLGESQGLGPLPGQPRRQMWMLPIRATHNGIALQVGEDGEVAWPDYEDDLDHDAVRTDRLSRFRLPQTLNLSTPCQVAADRGRTILNIFQQEFVVEAERFDRAGKHWTAFAMLVSHAGRVFLLVFASYADNDAVSSGLNFWIDSGSPLLTAFDIFEIPGRPLVKSP